MPIHREEGIRLFELGEYEHALAIFDELIRKDRYDREALFYKGNILGSLGNYAEAIRILSGLISDNPRDSDSIRLMNIFQGFMRTKKIFSSIAGKDDFSLEYSEREESPKLRKARSPASPARMPMPAAEAGYPVNAQPKVIDENILKELLSIGYTGEEASASIIGIQWNAPDEEHLKDLSNRGNRSEIDEFIGKVRLKGAMVGYLENNNVLTPRKYNTIMDKVEMLDSSLTLAFIMFEIGEAKFRRIEAEITGRQPPNNQPEPESDPRKNVWTAVLGFFLSIFGIERSFKNEKNKLEYFKYLFLFLGFLSVLAFLGYGLKMGGFKVNIHESVTTSSPKDLQKNPKKDGKELRIEQKSRDRTIEVNR